MVSQQKKYYDLNVPLTQSSAAGATSTSWTRKQLAQIYQTRFRQLGYSGIAFCHTTFSRLDANKDDADVVLPWRDLVSSSGAKEDTNCSFGRKCSGGMSIYRRINIVLEEVIDVSRLLLSSSNDQSASSIDKLLQKYDIVSLQPMNEPTLQNICELLPSSDSSSFSRPVDVIVLEYATGSRGGYGLPYKLRKDNLIKAMEAGVTFELCYATAMVDTKRRQGFLRSLTEFQSTYNSIQKKHMLLNKHINQRIDGKSCRSEQFPLLISSGSRQNYTNGTDEGMMTLRTPKDVHFLVGQSTGGDVWVDKNEYAEVTKDKKGKIVALSAAEKVLARAKDRSLGVITRQRGAGLKKRKISNDIIQAFVSGIPTGDNQKKASGGDSSDDDLVENNANSLIDWLSAPLQRHDSGADEAESDAEDQPIELRLSCNNVLASKDTALKEREQADDDEDLEDGYLAL
jgi:hypothetical protein